MTTSGRRIAIVALALVAGALAVVLALADLMVTDHATWLERSFRNRWAFRDVPTRRGSILDRNGVVLVSDVANFAVELDYTAFRREHPLGMAISAASLLSPGAFGYADAGAGVDAAWQRLLAMPVANLSNEVSPRDLARDLRFYVYGLGAAVAGVSRQEMARRLVPPIRAQAMTPIAAVIGVESARAVTFMRDRHAELVALDARLAGGRSLIAVLEELRAAHAAQPDVRPPPVVVGRNLPHEVVAELALAAESWPGLLARSTVEREPADLLRWPSLRTVLGAVTGYGAMANPSDTKRAAERAAAEHEAAAMIEGAELAQVFPDADGLEDEAATRLEDRAKSFLGRRIWFEGRVGRSGVEAAADEILAGQPGLRWVERDRRAREQLLYRSLDVAPGMDVHLTIDLRLQEILERVLDENARGMDTAMVVLDARTGDLLAIAGRPLELPGKDGPRPRLTSPAATWRSTGYVGSLAKPFVLLEQLVAEREGTPHVARADLAACARTYTPIGMRRQLRCDGQHGSDARDPVYALSRSCNVFFFQLSEGLGLAGLQRAYARAGWCDFPEAMPGFYQRSVPGISGSAASALVSGNHVLAQMGIGYGVDANAVMVARAYAALATGSLPTVGVVQELARPAPLPLPVTSGDLDLVRAGLRECVLAGTAREVTGLAELGVHGKTGTAEVAKSGENNAWFAGFVLAANARPTLAFAAVAYVVDDHGKNSAGMVRAFLRGILEHPDADLRRRWLDGLEER